jgi:hypothetical protein
MAKKMTPGQWEKSPADKKMDKAGAKKAGVSMKKFEGSKADNKADKAGLAKMNAKKK